jgi:thymidylate kinase
MLIVIVGPDGCGKTTIANELVEKLAYDGIAAKHSAMHFQIIPQLKELINPFLRNKIDTTHAEGELHVGMKKNPNSALRGLVYLVWYSVDYFLGHYRVWKAKKNKEVTIFARYYYDYYYQRGHINTPKIAVRLFEMFIPKPDLIITISRPALEIFNMKPELSISEIQRQQSVIENLFKGRKNAYTIDGTYGINETVNRAYTLLKKKY